VSTPCGTLTGQLAALGFRDTARALRLITADLGLDAEGGDAAIVEALGAAADPTWRSPGWPGWRRTAS
jgi:hypothetical protein